MQIGRIKEILTLIPKIYRGVISEQINCCEKGEKRAKISGLGNTHWLLKIQ